MIDASRVCILAISAANMLTWEGESTRFASISPEHCSITMYSQPTGLLGDAFHASTFGIGNPSLVRRKSIVATSLCVKRVRGPAFLNGMRTTTSLPLSNVSENRRLNPPTELLSSAKKKKRVFNYLQQRVITRYIPWHSKPWQQLFLWLRR